MTAATATGTAPKQPSAVSAAANVVRPNGCSRSAVAIWASGTRLLVSVAAASPTAAPSGPRCGISARSTVTFTVRASRTLARFHEVRPAIASTVSTVPQPVATSIAAASTTTTAAPARYPEPNSPK